MLSHNTNGNMDHLQIIYKLEFKERRKIKQLTAPFKIMILCSLANSSTAFLRCRVTVIPVGLQLYF